MARRRKDDALCPSRSSVWTADAERRWSRAFRLLLSPEESAQDTRQQEVRDGEDSGSRRAPPPTKRCWTSSRSSTSAAAVPTARRGSTPRCGRAGCAAAPADRVGCHRRRRARTTVADPTHAPAPDLVARDFAAAGPNRLWIGAITYVPTWKGWRYLAILLDAHARRVVGWALADHLRKELATEALAMALRARQPPAGLVHHTARGCQYTARDDQAIRTSRGGVASMSRATDCYDNAMAERFFATLKAERIDARPWPTRRAARQAIFAWLAVCYDRQRSHSARGYQRPVAFERALAMEEQAA